MSEVSHPYKTTGKIIIMHSLIFKFFGMKLDGKIFHIVITASRGNVLLGIVGTLKNFS
jgi:hypothetical protein